MDTTKIIKCDYCKKITLEKDIWKHNNLNICVFCLENKKRPDDYLKNIKIKKKTQHKKTIQKKSDDKLDTNIRNTFTNNEEENSYDLYIEETEYEEQSLYNEEDEDEYERILQEDELTRDALEFADPDDYYRNDDYDNETLWNDRDDDYDEGWRR